MRLNSIITENKQLFILLKQEFPNDQDIWQFIFSICLIGHKCFIEKKVNCKNCQIGMKYKNYFDSKQF